MLARLTLSFNFSKLVCANTNRQSTSILIFLQAKREQGYVDG